MKKSLLLILASLFAMFALAGCADDSKTPETPPKSDNQSSVDVELVRRIKQLVGYYKITFFHTNAGPIQLSSNCDKVEATNSSGDNCTTVEPTGYGQITVADNGTMTLKTKIQMADDIIKIGNTDSQYNYTEYKPIPASSFDMNKNTINANGNIKGVTGRNLKKNTNDDQATYSFTFDTTKNEITNTMTVTKPQQASNTIIMTKFDSLPSGYDMGKDTQFPEPQIDGFVANPTQ